MLTVVTHTRNDRPELLKRSAASVELALGPEIKHRIIECTDDWGKARLDATQLDEYVAFVDDDDTVEPGALELCLSVAKQTQAGIVVTDETLVDIEGKVIRRLPSFKSYSGLCVHPRSAHHLCLIRRDAVDPRALDLHRRYGNLGADWAIKTSAALSKGGIYVPIFGYNWTQHADTMNTREKNSFSRIMYQLGMEMRQLWKPQPGELPRWKL